MRLRTITLEALKPISLWTAGLYLLGFVWFPLMGIGNYALVRTDQLLQSEWVLISLLAVTLMGWSLKKFFA